jgi:hypothetical protein
MPIAQHEPCQFASPCFSNDLVRIIVDRDDPAPAFSPMVGKSRQRFEPSVADFYASFG